MGGIGLKYRNLPCPELSTTAVRHPASSVRHDVSAASNFRQKGGGGGGGGGGGLTRCYGSFEEFASEQYAKMESNETLGVPIVTSPDGPEASRSIPAAIIIGVQARCCCTYTSYA